MRGHGQRILLWDRWQATLPREVSVLARNTQIILADNVAEYLYSYSDQEDFSYENASDFPCVAPPFPLFWIEFSHPKAPMRCGAMVVASRVDKSQVGRPHNVRMAIGQDIPMDRTSRVVIPENAEWIMLIQYVFEANGTILRGFFQQHMIVDDSGRIAPWIVDGVEQFVVVLAQQQDSIVADFVHSASFPFLLTLCFMNCKNVGKSLQTPDKKLSKRHRGRTGLPLTKYHVLDISPMKKILRDEGGDRRVGLKKALHICRGHFKAYTAEHPLFGSHVGTYWWPMHVRGSREQGVVLKDYRVLASNAAGQN